jgi:hypothetical protein
MTRDKILAMKPGSMLDELVAEKVMDWNMTYNTHKNGRESDYSWSSAIDHNGKYRSIKPSKRNMYGDEWSPSTNITDSWEVLQHIRQNKLFSVRRKFMEVLQIVVSRKVAPNEVWLVMWPDAMWNIEPVDICKAALLVAFNTQT